MNQLVTLNWKGFVIPFSLTAYGNLTEMCKAYGKRPAKFLERGDTIEYLAALAANTGLPLEAESNCPPGGQLEFPAALIVSRRGRHESGTWAHPDITIECARWLYCSPKNPKSGSCSVLREQDAAAAAKRIKKQTPAK